MADEEAVERLILEIANGLMRLGCSQDDIRSVRRLMRLTVAGEAGEWVPIDLQHSYVNLPKLAQPGIGLIEGRSDERGLFYRKAVNSVHGIDASGKTLLLEHVMLQEAMLGYGTVWLNYEDADEAVIVDRLREMNVDQSVLDLVAVFNVTTPFDNAAIERLILERNARLVVVDSVGEAMAAANIEENKDRDVAGFFARHLRPLARLTEDGVAVVVIDHATKSQDNALFPAGSKRKRAAIDGAAYWCAIDRDHGQQFSKGYSGYAEIICAKDRHGYWQRAQRAAFFEITSVALTNEAGNNTGEYHMTTNLRDECTFIIDDGVDMENLRQSKAQAMEDRATLKAVENAIRTELRNAPPSGMDDATLLKKIPLPETATVQAVLATLEAAGIIHRRKDGWALTPDSQSETF